MNWLTFASALMAAAAAGAAAAAMALKYSRTRRPHAICWAISLALFAVACAILALGAAVEWSVWLFRLYYLAGGTLTVPWMALGAVYLFGPAHLARTGLLATLALTAVSVAVSVLSRVSIPAGGDGALPELRQALAAAPVARTLAVVANAGGTCVAIFLLLRASSTYRRKGVLPDKAIGGVVISIGIAAAAVGGALAAVQSVSCLALSLAIGAVLMLVGFVRWNRTPRINSKLAEVPT